MPHICALIWQQVVNGALADQPALAFNAPTGFPTDRPTTGSPIVTNSPSAPGGPRTPVVILPGAQSRHAAAPGLTPK
ncbi:hypothetical protein [Streptomyces sp. NBC_00986]|uniref:hypothetical protein n=1 Tax=Streptomyces sp. NBC_00986 TaxID=2903702 RepID=UPI00386D2906|nr:hypothetical protein OG504_01600 [Streptomyces sp. NBC_00986]